MGFIYGTELYGSERGNLAALQSMQRNGARITVGISNREESGGTVGAAARNMGFDTIEIPYGGALSGPSMTRYKSYRKRQLKRLFSVSRDILPALRSLNPTHVLIGSPLAHIYVAIALLKLRKPIIYRMGDAPGTDSKIQPYLWKALAMRANTIVANSHFVQSLVRHQGRQFNRKCTVIHNIAPDRTKEVDPNKIDHLTTTKQPFQLVYVGQLTARKGLPELIDALIALNDANIGCWIVGGPDADSALVREKQAALDSRNSQTHIQYMGFEDDPRPYYVAADWHIAPSTYDEPFANVTLEAKLCGTPSIVSNRGGFPEAVRHGIDGLITEPNVESLQAAILSVQKHGVNMGAAALQSTRSTFSQQRFDTAWCEVITAAQ